MKIIIMTVFISLTINSLQKDEITFVGNGMKEVPLLIEQSWAPATGNEDDALVIVAKGIKKVRIPNEQLPLICDENDPIFASSLLLSIVAMGGSAIYGLFTHPFPFNEHDCEGKYRNQIFEQCKKTNFPCNLEKNGWIDCIESLIDTFCDADRAEYNRQLPDKKIAAWAPLMIAATASVAFNGSWLACKKIGRALRPKIRFRPGDSTAIEMKEA